MIQESTGEFDWNAQEQGIILGAFYYGFIFTMLPGGYLSERYSGKWVLFVSFAGATLCNFLAPWTARQGGYVGFIILKVAQGFVQARISDKRHKKRSVSFFPILGSSNSGSNGTDFRLDPSSRKEH